MNTEDQLEQPCLGWFREGGWKRRLITSYHLDDAHVRRKIEKKWNRRLP